MKRTPSVQKRTMFTVTRFDPLPGRLLLLSLLALLSLAAPLSMEAEAADPARSILARFLPKLTPSELISGATAIGPVRDDIPVAPIERDGAVIGYAFATSDFVGTQGYSGKPIHVLVALDLDGQIVSAHLVKHWEPIILIGIPDSRIKALTQGYAGLDLVAEASAGGSGHELDIISGATVTVMVIDDSIVRAGLKVARALELGGLVPLAERRPDREVDPEATTAIDWPEIEAHGAVSRLILDVGQINAAFAATGDARAIARPEAGETTDLFLDLQTSLVSVPAIGRALLGEAEYRNLVNWLQPGEHAILVAGRGRYSFKGSGYVRGGVFDRFQLIQGDRSVRFRDKQQRRLGTIALPGAPSFIELDLFKIPADAGFEPTDPWRLQLLVHRSVGPVQKIFRTLDLGYRLPDAYTRAVAPASPAQIVSDDVTEVEAKRALWQRVWWENRIEIAGLLAMLLVLTAAFFFQMALTRRERLTFWFRIGFLTLTILFLGWHANAQLSVVNLMALGGALVSGFSWDAFLLDPMIFILWFSVAASLLFWGRGAYCGWLCPFGALQELTNRIAKACKVPQIALPWGLHERLWPIKYILFLGLMGIALASLPLAEQFAEIEPFKTAIVLKFQRGWPFVAFAVALLGVGLFIERFYCRYLCPLGAALAIPGRLRMFDWLKRYHDCGDPCQVCHNECMVQAIHPTGEINPNECLYCMHCQVRYQDTQICPVCVKRRRRMERQLANLQPLPDREPAANNAS